MKLNITYGAKFGNKPCHRFGNQNPFTNTFHGFLCLSLSAQNKTHKCCYCLSSVYWAIKINTLINKAGAIRKKEDIKVLFASKYFISRSRQIKSYGEISMVIRQNTSYNICFFLNFADLH